MQLAQILPFYFAIGVFLITIEAFMNIKLMRAYFEEKQLQRIVVIGCFEKTARIQLSKKLVFGQQSVLMLNINDNSAINFLKTDHIHVGIVFDCDCDKEKTVIFLKQCGTQKLFGVKYHWLVLASAEIFSHIFGNVELYVNSDIHVAHPRNNATSPTYVIEEVYNPAYGKGGELKRKILGNYDESMPYPAREEKNKYWTRKNMTGVQLKTHIVLPVAFKGKLSDYLNSEKHREINTFNRFHYSLMSHCVDYYNFTPNVSLTDSWGYLKEDGTFDGLVGALERQLVDYGSSPLFVRSDRATVMEYGRRTWTLRAAFLFRNPKAMNSIDIFIKPLSMSIWFLTIFSASLVIFLLKLACLCDKKNLEKATDTSWSYFVICTIGAFCQQGLTSTPFSYSGRIIVMSLLVLSLMIYQFYSASLVSKLLMKPETRIKTVKDILNSEMKVGCEDILYNRDYFLATFPDKSICELKEVQMYRTQPMHANYQKDSPFRDMFDTCLQRLAEMGLLNRQLTFWHPKKPECAQSKSVTFNIGLDYFYPAFVFLAIGMAVSLTVLTVEIYVNLKKQRFEENAVLVYPFLK